MTRNGATTEHFVLPELDQVRAEAAGFDTSQMVTGLNWEVQPASAAAAALALYLDEAIPTSVIKAAAEEGVAARNPRMHTFVPLYTTNHCDSACKMCGMRKGNTSMLRRFSGKKEIEDQLDILLTRERVRGVGFLTGEYDGEYVRLATAFRIGWAIRRALDMGFQRVYFNIGSMTDDEIDVLGEWFDPAEPVTMCVFQETYDKETYSRFMGDQPDIPKADYERRVSSFDRWIDAGFRYVNPGALIGLHRDVTAELVYLVSHAQHLAMRNGVVDISLPRLRPAGGTSNKSRVDDESYLRMMATIALVCPEQRLVLTNREGQEFQDLAVGLCGVFSPGSPDVAPYRRTENAVNDEKSSQFLVADLRRPSQILGRIAAGGTTIRYFEQEATDGVPQPA